MTDPEIKLKCIELAMQQARNEGKHGDRNSVAEITTLFYNLTQGTGSAPVPVVEPESGVTTGHRGKRKGADKSVFD